MVSEGNFKTFTRTEIDEMFARGEDLTDWDRLRSMTEEELEANADAQDAEYGIPPRWWENALVVHPGPNIVPLDREIIDWFRDSSPDFKSRINEVLRTHIFGHSKG